MNKRIKELALDAGLLLYVDHETPRHYFIDAGDDQENVEKFAELIIKEIENMYVSGESDTSDVFNFLLDVKKHFGVE